MQPPNLRTSIGGLIAVSVIVALAVVGASGPGASSPVTSAQAATRARPTVAFTTPKARARVSGRIRVGAKVSTRPAISRVEFRVDGKLRWTDRRRPFFMNGDRGRLATSTMSVGTHRLMVTAIAKNGRRRSATRTIRVTRTRGTAPVRGGGGSGGGAAVAPPPAVPVPTSAPAPAAVRLGLATQNNLGIVWNASPGATGYGVYINGQRLADVASPTYTFSGLSCGITYRIAIDSVASGGARSARALLTATTAGCPPASVFLSPSGNDASDCSAAAPCQSLDRGYHAAAPGAVVQLAAGSYPGGQITFDSSKVGAAGQVVLSPAAGASVTVANELLIGAQHLELRDMALANGWQTDANAADVVMRNLDSKHFFVNSSQQVSIIGGRVGPGQDYHPQIQSSNTTPPRDILVDGVTFHDWTASNTSVHTECLQIGSGDRITVRNSRFINCYATGNLHITHYGDAPRTRNVTIENNFFSSTVTGFYAVQAYAVQNLLIRNNSATGQGILVMPFPGDSVAANNVRVVANLAPAGAWECVAGVTYRSNVWYWSGAGQKAAKCNASDTALTGTSNPGFVNPGSLDLHLTASSPALGRGAATEAAATDIDGDPRAVGASDAGADER